MRQNRAVAESLVASDSEASSNTMSGPREYFGYTGSKPQHAFAEWGAASPDLAQLFREHERHLAAVFMTENRRVAEKQRLVDPLCAHSFHPTVPPEREVVVAIAPTFCSSSPLPILLWPAV
jgi:hypothetical protein